MVLIAGLIIMRCVAIGLLSTRSSSLQFLVQLTLIDVSVFFLFDVCHCVCSCSYAGSRNYINSCGVCRRRIRSCLWKKKMNQTFAS